jgi:hypothetical protein
LGADHTPGNTQGFRDHRLFPTGLAQFPGPQPATFLPVSCVV